METVRVKSYSSWRGVSSCHLGKKRISKSRDSFLHSARKFKELPEDRDDYEQIVEIDRMIPSIFHRMKKKKKRKKKRKEKKNKN